MSPQAITALEEEPYFQGDHGDSILKHLQNEDDIPSPQALPTPNEYFPDEKNQAHEEIRAIDPDVSVEDLTKGPAKQGTWASIKTLNASKSTTFSSFTAEKLRLRTSTLHPATSPIAEPWGVHWFQPCSMLGLYIFGVLGMTCHHVYNNWWSGNLVNDPQWPQRFGSGFSFFNQMCMVGAANIAYKQLVWFTIKKRDYTIETLDGMFSLCGDPMSYLNFELLFKATLPAILAGIVWCLPLCAIVTPSTLQSVGGSREKMTNCTAIPTLNFQNENGINENSLFIDGEGLSFFNTDPNDNFTFYYDSASQDLQKVEKLALLSSKPLTLPNPCEGGANCTWTFEFVGPSYDCQEKDDFDPSTGFSKDMLAPIGMDIYTSISSGSENEFGAPTFWETETWQNWTNIGTFDLEPTLWVGYVYNTTIFVGWNETWPFQMDPHVMECTLYNTTFEYNMSFKSGEMSINNLTKTLIAPALPSGSSIAPTDQNYEAFAAYHGAAFVFRDFFSSNITQENGTSYVATNSQIDQTSLVNPDTSYPVQHFPTQIEKQFDNIILSLAAFPSFYSQVNITGPCIITASVLQWDYQPFWLALSYGLAGFFTLIAVGIGLFAFRANGYSADTNFSTFLNTTRNVSLDRLSEGSCLGQTPLPKEFMKLKLRFGEMKGVGDGKEHVAFGLASETGDILFGKRYV